MIDPQQNVLLEVTPIELWILYHRINQNHHSFWYGKDRDRAYGDDKQDIANDVDGYQDIKHNLWIKIDGLMTDIDMHGFRTISSQLSNPIKVNDHNVEFDTNGDVSVGCEDISYDTLKQVYEKATKLRKE